MRRFRLKGKIITVLIIAFLIGAWIYLRIIGFLGDWETVIFSLLSIILPLIPYCFQPKVVLKIKNVRFTDEKQVNHDIGYYLKATVINKGKKICFNIDACFDIKDESGKPPPLLCIKTVETNGEKSVSTEIKPFDEKLEYVWVKDGYPHGRILEELRHGDEFDLIFPWVPLGEVMRFSFETHNFDLTKTECLLKLDSNKRYQVKITVKGEDSERNTVEATKKVKMKVKSSYDSQ